THKKNGFPKSFRLAKHYWNQEPKIVSFRLKLPPAVKDESLITNEVQQFIHSNIKALVLDEHVLADTLCNCIDLKDEILVKRNAELFRRGAINVRGGRKQRRVTHRLTVCPREMRRAFRLKDEFLAEFDIPCCQPTLLLVLSDKI